LAPEDAASPCEGAYDYLTKPIDLEELDLLMQRSENAAPSFENRLLREQLAERYSFAGIVSQSAGMEAVLNTAGRVAHSRASY
jgi:DNA-binding NtrC family response regulator